MGWDPYHEADLRPHLEIQWHELPPSTGGGLYVRYADGTAVVALDRRLTGPERSDVLTHELVHDERGGGAKGAGIAWCRPERAKDERTVRSITADRLVPTRDLQRFCDREADLGHGVGPQEVTREFDVSWLVACDALDNLTRHERGQAYGEA